MQRATVMETSTSGRCPELVRRRLGRGADRFHGRPWPFREGTTLEELGAFTTPTMPPTLAFEAEMTVATGTSFDGYSSSQGSLSLGTFDVGGVQYTVDTVGFSTDSNEFNFHITPALPFANNTLTFTLGATELPGGSADFFVNNSGSGIYGWQEPNPNWASGATVDVKLDIGLVDICGRSQAVATPSWRPLPPTTSAT